MVASTLSRYGALHILVNCAAGNFLAPAEELTSNGFKTVMEIDTMGTFNTSRAAFKALSSSSSSSSTSCIINISATLHYGATWYQAHASAAKAAIDSLTRTLALEWGTQGIRVVGIAPGPIKGTAGITKLAPGAADAASEVIRSRVPLGKMGEKWDVAMACVYLSSEAGGYVTGHTMVVDGGEWMYREPLLPREAVSKVSRGVEGESRKVGLASDGEMGGGRSRL
jgi:2,4-dienoyl-CoA reductase [(3E)-enoyl-CoA-producing], peroxisomal